MNRFPIHFRFQLTDSETTESVTNCDRLLVDAPFTHILREYNIERCDIENIESHNVLWLYTIPNKTYKIHIKNNKQGSRELSASLVFFFYLLSYVLCPVSLFPKILFLIG